MRKLITAIQNNSERGSANNGKDTSDVDYGERKY
jgi:hypothetical protein